MDTTGAVLDTQGVVVGTAANWQQRPAVAANGQHYLVVWSDLRAGGQAYDVWGARVKPTGEIVDTSGILIGAAASEQDLPSVASDGTDFLVAWRDFRAGLGTYDVYANRVTAAGAVASPAGFAVSAEAEHQDAPRVAWAGTQYLVVWQDRRSTANYDVWGAFVPAGGPTAAFAIAAAGNDQVQPAVAGSGTSFVVTWVDKRSNANGDVYAAPVSSAGAVGTEVPVVAGGTNAAPSIGALSSELLVAWECYHSGSGTDVCGARLSSTGSVLGAVDVSRANGGERGPVVSADGSEYLVAWLDGRKSPGGDVYAARVSSGGVLQDATGFVVNDSALANSWPAAASQAKGNWLVAYHRFIPEAPTGASRIRAAIVTDVPVCAADPDCNDGDPCTADTCNASHTCEHAFVCQADAAAPGPDAAAPAGPDAATPGPDAAAPGPDAATAGPDAAAPGPDAATPGPDAGAPGPDAGSPGSDASAPRPDAAAAGADAALPGADASAPGADASSPGSDASAPGPDAGASRPDAAPAGEDASQVSAPDAAIASRDAAAVDAAEGPADAAEVAADAAPAFDPTATVVSGCGCGTAGAPAAIQPLAFLAVIGVALGRRRRRD